MRQNSSRLVDLILCAVLLGFSHPALAGSEAGFRSLLEGNDLGGWDGDKRLWSIKDGVITGRTTADRPLKANTFLIWREGMLDDFELHFSYRIRGGNSGVQYRSKDLGNWSVGGYQADLEAGQTYSGILYEEKGRGILAERGQKTVVNAAGQVKVQGSVGNSAELQAAIRHQDWNDYVIVARGNHLIHKINGNVTVDVRDNQIEERSRSGILALQLHVGPPMQVQFKNLHLKRLKLETEKKIVLVAGHPSHAPGDHEFNAGVQLLHRSLQAQPGVLSAFYLNGWPSDPSAFDNADTIVLYMDGGSENPMIQGDHLDILAGLTTKGVGLACLHYALEVPREKGGQEFAALARRLLRDRLFHESTLVSRNQRTACSPDHPGSPAFQDQGRVVLQHPFPPDDGGDHAHSGGGPVRRSQAGTNFLASRTLSSHCGCQQARGSAGLGCRETRWRTRLRLHGWTRSCQLGKR